MKKIMYAVVIIAAIVLVQNVFDVIVPEQSVNVSAAITNSVEETFEEYDVDKSICQIEGYYYYGTRYMNDIRRIELLDSIAEELGINSSYMYDEESTDEGYVATITKEGDKFSIVIKSTTVEENVSENILTQRTYISINLDIYNSVESGYYYKNKIEEVMKKVCEKGHKDEEAELENSDKINCENSGSTYLVIKGSMQGKVSVDTQKELGTKLMERLGADKIFDKADEDVYSLYAYNKSIKNYVSIGKNRLNVNVAFGYNELENVTCVYIGSPIVNYDY